MFGPSCAMRPGTGASRQVQIQRCGQHSWYAKPHWRPGSAAGIRSAVQSTATALPQQLDLQGRTCAVLWDLDNVCPGNVRGSLLPAIKELKALLQALGSDQSPAVTCYANSKTCKMLGVSAAKQLSAAGVDLVQVEVKQQAADVRLSSTAYSFAQTHRHRACLVVVTSDTGFAPVLAYCTSLDVTTILLTAVPSPKYMPGFLPDLRGNSLAAACTAALPWQQSTGAKQRLAGNRLGLQQQQQHLQQQQQHLQQQQQQQQGDLAQAAEQQGTEAGCSADARSVEPVQTPAQLAGATQRGSSTTGSSVPCRSPLHNSARFWHPLERLHVDGAGYIEPWLFLRPSGPL